MGAISVRYEAHTQIKAMQIALQREGCLALVGANKHLYVTLLQCRYVEGPCCLLWRAQILVVQRSAQQVFAIVEFDSVSSSHFMLTL